MIEQQELWTVIIEIHQAVKNLQIKAEEFDLSLKAFIQPILEQRNAYEHFIRAKANELGIGRERDLEYIEDNLKKTLGHECRSFFDIADWLGINIRKKIINLLHPYSHNCINVVIPEYYKQYRPSVEEMNIKIAELRGAKDSAKGAESLEEVRKYKKQIDRLLEVCRDIVTHIPSLEDCHNRENRKTKLGIIVKILLVVLGAVLAFLGNCIYKHFFG